MSNSVQPQRQQPIRHPHPWDSPGKDTGVGCHFLLQCMKVKSESEVAQSCPTPSDLTDCSLPVSSIHGICQARVLEWVAIAFSIISWGWQNWGKSVILTVRYEATQFFFRTIQQYFIRTLTVWNPFSLTILHVLKKTPDILKNVFTKSPQQFFFNY